jgi:methyl-accepting chemotaxis protein
MASRAGTRFAVRDLSVRTKILLAVAVGGTVALIIGINGITAMSRSSASAERLYGNVSGISAVGAMHAAMLQARLDLANHAISQDEATIAKYEAAFDNDVNAAEAAFSAYSATDPVSEAAALQKLHTDWQQYVQIARDKQIPASRRHDLAAWQTTRDQQIKPLLDEMFAGLTNLDAAEDADASASAASARSDARSSRILAITLLVVGLTLALALGYLVARGIVRSLSRVRQICDALAQGDLTRTAGLTSRDEPGQMAQSLDTAVGRLRETVATISGSATSLAGAAEQMSGVAIQIAASAEETSAQAQTVSAAAEQISRSVETVSSGSEEMGASIREISQNATEAAQVAGEAVGLAASTSTTMSKLGDSSAEIGNVIKVITAIAEQTNLLALNATIEAARAGEAGKGFAVVASEVKDLAQETARATEDISRRVETIQADTGGAVTAIEEISRVIARISDFQTTIASAVEEQTATTSEMNRSVSEAASGTGEIAENITGVAEAARSTSQGVTQSQQATAELNRMSAELSQLVSGFRY